MKQKKAVKRKYFGSTLASVTEFGGKYFVEGYYYRENGDGTGMLMPGLRPCADFDEAKRVFNELNSYQDVLNFVENTRVDE